MVVFADRTAAESIGPAERRDRLHDLPPSAKLVYAALEADPGLDQSTLATRSRLSKRTVRHALATLTDADVVEKRISPLDARRRVYRPLPVEDAGGLGGTLEEAAERTGEAADGADDAAESADPGEEVLTAD